MEAPHGPLEHLAGGGPTVSTVQAWPRPLSQDMPQVQAVTSDRRGTLKKLETELLEAEWGLTLPKAVEPHGLTPILSFFLTSSV